MNQSGYLFARPSFLTGIARLLDLGGTLAEYNRAISPEQADALAIRADWQPVGEISGEPWQRLP